MARRNLAVWPDFLRSKVQHQAGQKKHKPHRVQQGIVVCVFGVSQKRYNSRTQPIVTRLQAIVGSNPSCSYLAESRLDPSSLLCYVVSSSDCLPGSGSRGLFFFVGLLAGCKADRVCSKYLVIWAESAGLLHNAFSSSRMSDTLQAYLEHSEAIVFKQTCSRPKNFVKRYF